MDLPTNISAKKIKRNLKLTAGIFSIALAFGINVAAQKSINDDLKPSTAIVKTKTESKTPVKTAKKTTTRKVKKSNFTRPATTVSSPANNFSNYETSDQVINRFMNFQQSSGVTNRDWKNVVAQTAKTLKMNPNHSMAKAQSFIAQGQIALSENNFSSAISNFKSALQILPSSSLPHYSLGKAYLANGQADAAARSFKEAINQNENFALAYKGLGDAYNAQGEKKTAVKYFKKATEIGVKDGNMAP